MLKKMQQKKRNQMPGKLELTEEQIAEISGGTTHESVELMLALASRGNGTFLKINDDRDDILDIEGMKECLAAKGYKFIPAFGEQELNMFIGPDGLPYGNDYIVHLLKTGQL